MKLEELKKFPVKPVHLQDLAGLGIKSPYSGIKENYIYPPYYSEWQLNEMAYRVNWKEEDNKFFGYFSSPEFEYRIVIEPFHYLNYNCANIAFEVFKEEKHTTELTSTTFSNSVFGTVLNASSEKITHFDIDAIVFIAVDNINKRMSLYKRLADKFAKNFGQVFEKVKLTNGEAIIIISNNIPEKDRADVYQYVLTQSEVK